MSVLFHWLVPFSGPFSYVFLLRCSSLFSGGREDGGDFRVSLAPQLFFFGEEHVTCTDDKKDTQENRVFFLLLLQYIDIYSFTPGIPTLIMSSEFPAIQPGGSLIVAWQVRDKRVLVVGGGEVRFSPLFSYFRGYGGCSKNT